jgi:SAM-dependent methyltransferase
MPASNFYHQVGRTVGGLATGENDLNTTSEAIRAALQLVGDEVVLDLCCGNGLLTKKIAPYCRRLIGVDYSEPLITIAKRCHSFSNVEYMISDVLCIGPELIGLTEVQAAYLAFAFQYFDAASATELLQSLRSIAAPGFRLFIEGIADETRLFDFYDTPERLAEYRRRRAEGSEQIVNWWNRSALVKFARSEGFHCVAMAQGPERVCAHYRFDALLTIGDAPFFS